MPPSPPAPSDPLAAAVANLHRQALAHHRAGRLGPAAEFYRQLLEQAPGHAEAAHMLGLIEFQASRFESALTLIQRAIGLTPGNAAAHSDLGVTLQALQQHGPALASYDRALALEPMRAGAHNNRGNALQALQRHAEAILSYERALQIRSDPAALYNLGNCQQQLQSHADAISSYQRALALRPDYPEALNNRASSLRALGRHDQALASCEAALRLRPAFPDALHNRATALRDLGRIEAAVEGFAQLLALAPDYPYAAGTRFHLQLQGCDWRGYHRQVKAINQAVEQDQPADLPFSFLAISQSPATQRRCASAHVAHRFPPAAEPLWQGQRYAHERIRLAYLSSDFGDHPMAHLMADLFELHDRQRFELIGISYGPDRRGAMRDRLSATFDHFVDVRALGDRAVADLLREREVDIAVDLNGLTEHCRTGILALRPAPIQVNYLGYPGSMGSSYIDYILADARVIPADQQQHYCEHVVRLPDSYQANDRKRRTADTTPSRAALGLPETGFVFCCFNNNYKISPDVFDVWMRLLHQVEASVLWLHQGHAAIADNLRCEARERGIDPGRLIFKPALPVPEYLSRYRHADLFLDTLPYNAHTTASDALWAGLPVLTCTGTSFAGRVAGSLLHAAGLPELITHSMPDYEALALQLARDPHRLGAIKQKLARNRDSCPLFDTPRFCRHIEAAYLQMHQRHLRGEPPESFNVLPVD